MAEPNQQYRIDLMKPAAVCAALASADILMTVFQDERRRPAENEADEARGRSLEARGQERSLRWSRRRTTSAALDAAIDGVKVKTSK